MSLPLKVVTFLSLGFLLRLRIRPVNLKATNGQIIGTSQLYENEASRDNGIASVKTNAPEAIIDDRTN